MTFNWFNRKFDDKAASTEPAESTPPAETAPEATTPKPEDYLSFAKAAYRNIQKRQQAEAGETQTTDDASVAAETPAEPTAEAEAPESAVEEIPAPEELVPERSIAAVEEPPIAEIEVPEVLAPETLPTPIEETSAPEEASALPFWARAEAEREARLERLRATAIPETIEETPAPSPTPEGEATLPDTLPDLVFDEGFLWSAEVLAGQGRRAEDVSVEEITWLKRLRQGLDKTRRNLVNQLKAIVGQGPLNQDAVMEIESLLLQADAGVEATDIIIQALQSKLRQEALPPDEAIAYLKQILRELLDRPLEQTHNASFAPEKDNLNIWLITGVNGAGKTTTIGKLAHIGQKSGYRCLIAAADTFRAAAVEQVKVWGGRSGVEVIANPGQNTDPAAVVFDAITAAQSRNTELLLVDTAGRLQNKKNLMDELGKVRRIIDKKAGTARVESLLVLDATLGQNGLRQAQVFSEVAQLSGVVLTKLDGTAKGGVALAVVQQLGIPIRFIGAGEGIEDLRPFSSYEFVEALLSS